ncbi:MAG: hypothetical protein CM15mP46_7360 [Alphaproteobacteria bacterium]|nr:MAG: hypothetical protein CM15mP46_7360 [Alphaproteobacteria bacterium]
MIAGMLALVSSAKLASRTNFTPKPGVAICLPDNDGHIEQAVGVVMPIYGMAQIIIIIAKRRLGLQVYDKSIVSDQLGQLALGWGWQLSV